MVAIMLAVLSSGVWGAPVWLTAGHAIVCEIAWLELTPLARTRLDQLLAADPGFDEFAPSCDWPDMIRDDRAYDGYLPAHDVYVPPGATGVDVARDCGPELCAVDGIEEFARRLPGRSRRRCVPAGRVGAESPLGLGLVAGR